jgi:6-pyruvoyltetrahydropterin/6-carboxytetrahydropterin synthase
MILDFNELKVIKEFLDGFVDHRFLMDIEDPLLKSWMEKYGLKMEDLEVNSAGFVFDTKSFKDECEIEFFNSLVILPFVPTSENLALWLFSVVEGLVHKVNKELNKKVKVVKLRWWESESSFAEVG